MEKRILVIDDEEEVCKLLEDFLIKEGFQVTTALSAKEGLEKLQQEKIEVILLDIKMPEMDGIEAIKRIRELNKTVGIIMTTAVMDQKVAEEAMRLGASEYILKPFDLNYLKNSLLVKIATLE